MSNRSRPSGRAPSIRAASNPEQYSAPAALERAPSLRSGRSVPSQPRSRSSYSSARSYGDLPGAFDMRETGYLPEVGRFAVTGIPGYTGYVPGKYPENVLGATHQRGNELSLLACDRRSFPEEVGAKYNPGGLRTRDGYNVPGYTGFVPGKYADNVFGHVFARINATSTVVKQDQARDRAEWRQPTYT